MLKKKKLKKGYKNRLTSFLKQEGLLYTVIEELEFYYKVSKGEIKDEVAHEFQFCSSKSKCFMEKLRFLGVKEFLRFYNENMNSEFFDFAFDWEYQNNRGISTHLEDIDWTSVSLRWHKICEDVEEKKKKRKNLLIEFLYQKGIYDTYVFEISYYGYVAKKPNLDKMIAERLKTEATLSNNIKYLNIHGIDEFLNHKDIIKDSGIFYHSFSWTIQQKADEDSGKEKINWAQIALEWENICRNVKEKKSS